MGVLRLLFFIDIQIRMLFIIFYSSTISKLIVIRCPYKFRLLEYSGGLLCQVGEGVFRTEPTTIPLSKCNKNYITQVAYSLRSSCWNCFKKLSGFSRPGSVTSDVTHALSFCKFANCITVSCMTHYIQ